jgi:hypothetical protein
LRHIAPSQAQPKAPDSYALRAYTEELLGSLNAQAQAPDDPSPSLLDFQLLSLRAYMEMLLASFNAQEQAPDDILAQDRQWAPCLFVENLRHCGLVFARLSTKEDSSHFSLHLVSQDSAQEFFHGFLSSYLGAFLSSFLFGDLPKRHMWGVFLISSIGFF